MPVGFQENLEMEIKNGKHKLVGFVNLGESHEIMNSLSAGKPSTCMLIAAKSIRVATVQTLSLLSDQFQTLPGCNSSP